MNIQTKEFAVAPMLDVTDRHCRAFLRLFSPHFRLYTEMVVSGSIIYGDKDRFLGFNASEHPVALQLGGSDPEKLAVCARLGEEYGYDEVNLNIGCPSDRVKSAQFGACLMAKPDLVADSVAAMRDAVTVPVSVKTRLGIDHQDSYDFLCEFIEKVACAGCEKFIVHARKAWLSGLSPKQNRDVPPLHYERVYQLKSDYPNLMIVINGGIETPESVQTHLEQVDGIMMGREIYQNPWRMREIANRFFNSAETDYKVEGGDFDARVALVREYLPYIETQLARGVYLRHMSRHMMGVFHGQGGAKSWRRYLSEFGPDKNAGLEVIEQALKLVHPRVPKAGSDSSEGNKLRELAA